MTFGRGRGRGNPDSEEEEEEEIIFKEKKERIKTQEEGEIKISTQGKVITIKHHKGMTNQRFNVITARSMVTLQMNAKRNKKI
jgi:ABC-type histidine transport system ATPase subunit